MAARRPLSWSPAIHELQADRQPARVHASRVGALRAATGTRAGLWHARVGQRVSDYRAAHGLTLAEMASRVGCGGPERLAAIEAGADDIRLDDLERVGAVIGCEVPELLEADESEWTHEVGES